MDSTEIFKFSLSAVNKVIEIATRLRDEDPEGYDEVIAEGIKLKSEIEELPSHER